MDMQHIWGATPLPRVPTHHPLSALLTQHCNAVLHKSPKKSPKMRLDYDLYGGLPETPETSRRPLALAVNIQVTRSRYRYSNFNTWAVLSLFI